MADPQTEEKTDMRDLTGRGAGAADTGDVVELILADHREFEDLLRALRNREEDRAARLRELADLLVAHAEAEEQEVYPALRARAPGGEQEIAHSYTEHAEGHEALLALQEVGDVGSAAFEDALEELSETLTHHLDEEERDVLNAAREQVDVAVREKLGEGFLRVRREQLRAGAGRPDNVRALVEQAQRRGVL